jgi:peptide/nickel transport system permease protein
MTRPRPSSCWRRRDTPHGITINGAISIAAPPPGGPQEDAVGPDSPVRAWRILSPAMRRLVVRRVLLTIPTAILASVVLFLLIRMVPGGPAIGILGVHASPASIAALNKELSLDHPLVQQYWQWLTGALRGNLGQSLQTQQPVAHMVGQSFAVSAELVGLAALFTVIFALPVGVLAAQQAGTRLDRGLSNASGLGLAVPDFFLAVILIAIFGIAAHLLPELGPRWNASASCSGGSPAGRCP